MQTVCMNGAAQCEEGERSKCEQGAAWCEKLGSSFVTWKLFTNVRFNCDSARGSHEQSSPILSLFLGESH